jgi:D-alanyl-D-alanine carboxypeptidase/D-alanyl-D-alanine-endopeptidase (penicillin-binding protein 4)
LKRNSHLRDGRRTIAIAGVAGIFLWTAVVAVAEPSRSTTSKDPARRPPPPTLDQALTKEVETARRSVRELGVSVVDLAEHTPAFAYDADSLRILASNTKILTTATALSLLGADHVFETRVMGRGEITDGVLNGPLAIVGGGDPNISGRFYDGDSYAVFRGWARALLARGIRRVAGDLMLVNGLFTGPNIHPDWPRDQLSAWYEAPVEALSFNDNCVLVRVRPGRAPGHAARVETIPPLAHFTIQSTATTTSKRGGRLLIGRMAESDTLVVSGAIAQRSGPVDEWVAVSDPTGYFAAAVRSAFAEEGIEIGGVDRPAHGPLDGDWELLAIHQSDIARTLEITNKRSQNFYAESLAKYLGWKLRGEGSWAAGVGVVGEFLGTLGVPAESFRLADGSGLSRANVMTPNAMTSLLDRMYFHPLGREFVRSLPFSGEPGLRWQRRLARPPYAGNVFAKTGTIRGVSTLSGYAKAASGKVYAFSILCNQVRSTSDAQAAQDRIVSALIDRG